MGERIYLKNNQGALILSETGPLELHIPKMNDEDTVPDFIAFLTTISILLKTNDERFQKYMARCWNEIVKNHDSTKQPA